MPDTSEIANKALDVASKNLDALSSKLQDLAHTYGPDIVNSTLMVARIDAINACVGYVFWFVINCVLVFVGIKLYRWCRNERDDDAWLVAIFYFTGTSVSIIACIVRFSIWPFIGAYEPKLWIAHKILDLA